MENTSNGFGLNGLSIILLRQISKLSLPVQDGRLKSSAHVLFTADQFEEALMQLKSKQYITVLADDLLQIGDPGKQFLEIYDLYEHEELLAGNLIFVILKFLTQLQDSISTVGFPKSIIDYTPQEYYAGSTENLNHFLKFDEEMKRYVLETKDRRYAINSTGQSRFEIEAKKRVKSISLTDTIEFVLDHLDKQPDSLEAILMEHGVTDSTVVRRIESYLKDRDFIGLTNQGAYIKQAGRAHLVQQKLNTASPVVHIHQITTHGDNSPIAAGGALTVGALINKNNMGNTTTITNSSGTFLVNSDLRDFYQTISARGVSDETVRALAAVSEKVEHSKDASADVLVHSFREELKKPQPDKSRLSSIWGTLVKIVPDILKMGDSIKSIISLFS